MSTMTQLTTVDLSDNLYTESVPALDLIPNIEVLRLSRNQFEGLLPEWPGSTSPDRIDRCG